MRFVPSSQGRAFGVVLDTGMRSHDQVVTTQLRPGLEGLLARDLLAAMGPDPTRYLGVVCLVVRTRRSVSPFYAVNITDRSVPLTTVVETTHVVDPERAGGTLLYVPKYVDPDSPELERSSREIRREYLGHVARMFPSFDPADVLHSQVARARVAEPVHVLGARRPAPEDAFVAPGPGRRVLGRRLPRPRQRPGRPRRGRAPGRRAAGPPRRGHRGGAGRMTARHRSAAAVAVPAPGRAR